MGKTGGPCLSQCHSLFGAQGVTTNCCAASGLANPCDDLGDGAQLVDLSESWLPSPVEAQTRLPLITSIGQHLLLGTHHVHLLPHLVPPTIYFVGGKASFWNFRKLPKLPLVGGKLVWTPGSRGFHRLGLDKVRSVLYVAKQ